MISSPRHIFDLILHIVAKHIQYNLKPGNPSMFTGAILDLTRSRSELMLENAFLRQQLIVLNRQVIRPARDVGQWVAILEAGFEHRSARYPPALASGSVPLVVETQIAKGEPIGSSTAL